MRKKSKYIEALEELGGEATTTQIRDLLRSKGLFCTCALIWPPMARLQGAGKVDRIGRGKFRLALGNKREVKWTAMKEGHPRLEGLYVIRWPSGAHDVLSLESLLRYRHIDLLWLGPLPEDH